MRYRFGEKDSQEEAGTRRQAVALGYDPQKDGAPRVLASGKDELAERILALAREHDVPIEEDPLLAAALSQIELDTEIPPELYLVVAEVFAYLHQIRERINDGEIPT